MYYIRKFLEVLGDVVDSKDLKEYSLSFSHLVSLIDLLENKKFKKYVERKLKEMSYHNRTAVAMEISEHIEKLLKE